MHRAGRRRTTEPVLTCRYALPRIAADDLRPGSPEVLDQSTSSGFLLIGHKMMEAKLEDPRACRWLRRDLLGPSRPPRGGLVSCGVTRPACGMTWLYVVIVSSYWDGPGTSMTTRAGTRIASSKEAAVCSRRAGGRRARRPCAAGPSRPASRARAAGAAPGLIGRRGPTSRFGPSDSAGHSLPARSRSSACAPAPSEGREQGRRQDDDAPPGAAWGRPVPSARPCPRGSGWGRGRRWASSSRAGGWPGSAAG